MKIQLTIIHEKRCSIVFLKVMKPFIELCNYCLEHLMVVSNSFDIIARGLRDQGCLRLSHRFMNSSNELRLQKKVFVQF
jgi:hypothetical protein